MTQKTEIPAYAPVASSPPSDLPGWENIEALLRQVPIFAPLQAAEIQALARSARLVHCQPSDRIITQGQPGSSLFVVAAGTFEVLGRQPDGHDWLINRLLPGSVFGEIALLMGGKRTATIRAMTEGVLYEISKKQLQPILTARPQLVIELSVLMVNRQADTAEQSRRHSARQEQVNRIARRIRSFVLGAPG